MSKSKDLTLANAPALALHQDEFSVPLLRINQFHQVAQRAGAQMVTAAVLAGLELVTLQKALKKSATRVGWLDFLSIRLKDLGFGERTANRYMRLADDLKSKLLKSGDGKVLALLHTAPSAMSEKQANLIGEAVRKSIDGASLSELYLELGITRRTKPPSTADRLKAGTGDGNPPPMIVPPQQRADEAIQSFFKFADESNQKVKLGKEEVTLLTLWPDDQLAKFEEYLEAKLAEVRQLKKARRK